MLHWERHVDVRVCWGLRGGDGHEKGAVAKGSEFIPVPYPLLEPPSGNFGKPPSLGEESED